MLAVASAGRPWYRPPPPNHAAPQDRWASARGGDFILAGSPRGGEPTRLPPQSAGRAAGCSSAVLAKAGLAVGCLTVGCHAGCSSAARATAS
eukprot:3101392-Prymnesium_polylepis.1